VDPVRLRSQETANRKLRYSLKKPRRSACNDDRTRSTWFLVPALPGGGDTAAGRPDVRGLQGSVHAALGPRRGSATRAASSRRELAQDPGEGTWLGPDELRGRIEGNRDPVIGAIPVDTASVSYGDVISIAAVPRRDVPPLRDRDAAAALNGGRAQGERGGKRRARQGGRKGPGATRTPIQEQSIFRALRLRTVCPRVSAPLDPT